MDKGVVKTTFDEGAADVAVKAGASLPAPVNVRGTGGMLALTKIGHMMKWPWDVLLDTQYL